MKGAAQQGRSFLSFRSVLTVPGWWRTWRVREGRIAVCWDGPLTIDGSGSLAVQVTHATAPHRLRSAGRHQEAIALDEQTLTDRERVLGPDHPHTLHSRNNLAGADRRVRPRLESGSEPRATSGAQFRCAPAELIHPSLATNVRPGYATQTHHCNQDGESP